uniref:ATP synthase F0 subunit 8 n=1 Tax=Philine kinglipini TaxID=3030995 RepID=UPI002552056D|nr:ATP synthase F0 subunit 8 [Philine kinglipini]WFG53985.1 ATP synthase F0 subunit 8 [Philine kinglipini]
MPQLSPTLGFLFFVFVFLMLMILVFNSSSSSSFVSGGMSSTKSKFSKKFIVF